MSDDGKDDKKKDEEEELDCSHPEVVNKYQQAGAVANGNRIRPLLIWFKDRNVVGFQFSCGQRFVTNFGLGA